MNRTAEFSYNFNPNAFEWCLLVFAFTIFVIGIIGNLLVIIVVVKNAHMRTITNIFIVNLAIGDFLVILICLPPSVITDIAGSWWFGETMCKIIPYVQYISVFVSVLTLTSISYERYQAIVYPLKLLGAKTFARAIIIISIIWLFSILINIPHPLVLKMVKGDNFYYSLSSCYPTWNKIFQNILDLSMFVILYLLPMALIFYTNNRVIKVLWNIDQMIEWVEDQNVGSSVVYSFSKRGGQGTQVNNSNPNELRNPSRVFTTANGSSIARAKLAKQLIGRRRAAKILICVAVLFAICYLPIHILNIFRFIDSRMLENVLGDFSITIFQIAHCLVYLNSCLNPLIYNFLSPDFRKEFSQILSCNYL